MATVKEVENKLGPLAQLHELSQSTEERLTALNALAEHVVAQGQGAREPAAVGRARRRPGQPRQRDGLGDGRADRQAERRHEAGGARRGDDRRASRSCRRRPTPSSRPRPSCGRRPSARPAKLKKEATALLDAVRGQVDTLALKKKEFEAFDERLRALHAGVGDAESRMEALAAKDKNLIELTQKVDGLVEAVRDAVRAGRRADEEAARRSRRCTSGSAQVDELAKKTSWQLDSLRQSRQDLDVLRKEIQEFYKSHAEIGQAGRQARRRSARRSRRSASA